MLKKFDDLVAGWTISAGSAYFKIMAKLGMACGWYGYDYINTVVNELTPLVKEHTLELGEAWAKLERAEDVAEAYARLDRHLMREDGPTCQLIAKATEVSARAFWLLGA